MNGTRNKRRVAIPLPQDTSPEKGGRRQPPGKAQAIDAAPYGQPAATPQSKIARFCQKLPAPLRLRHGGRGGRGPPKYYTIKAVAEALDVSSRSVRRWIANGDLPVHRVGGVVRIAEGDLLAFLASHREG